MHAHRLYRLQWQGTPEVEFCVPVAYTARVGLAARRARQELVIDYPPVYLLPWRRCDGSYATCGGHLRRYREVGQAQMQTLTLSFAWFVTFRKWSNATPTGADRTDGVRETERAKGCIPRATTTGRVSQIPKPRGHKLDIPCS
eukprot:1395093-Amorphochlora_amoeboformis.AAC.1